MVTIKETKGRQMIHFTVSSDVFGDAFKQTFNGRKQEQAAKNHAKWLEKLEGMKK